MSVLLHLRERFWFLPAVLSLSAFVLAEALVTIDEQFAFAPPGWLTPLLFQVGESGSRDILGTIGSSALAVAGTTFSITMAVLALTSSTYGPRLVRNFMADRGNQLVLGVFVATYLYCLLVLRAVRVPGDPGNQRADVFIPHVAVNVAVLLAVLNVGVLVYFIHHISDSIQIATLASAVRVELRETVDRLYPARAPHDASDVEDADGALPERLAEEGLPVRCERPGYVQTIQEAALVRTARRHDVVLALQVRPGRYVVDGTVLALVHPAPADGDDAERLCRAVRSAFTVANARSPFQDVDFAVQQLTEMAVRALSPGTNDPYTAVNALDDLSAGLVLLAQRRTPSAGRYDDDGTLRMHAPRPALADLVDTVLDSVRWYAAGAPLVMHTALQLVERVAARTQERQVRARLLAQLGLLQEAFESAGHHRHDVEKLAAHVERVRRVLARAAL